MAQPGRGINIKPSKKTTTTHVGNERFGKLEEIAIYVSFHGKKQITPSEFNRYLIDNFGEPAKLRLIAEMQAEANGQES